MFALSTSIRQVLHSMGETENNFYLKQLSDHYEKVYVVNIERTRKHRLEKLKQNLKGLAYEFFEGVDATLLSPDEINHIADLEKSREYLNAFYLYRYGEQPNRTLRNGEIGCSYSHLKIYREMVEKGWKKVLILEDDARIDFSQVHLIPEMLRDIPADCDVFYWGYRWYDCETPFRRFLRLYVTTPIKKIYASVIGIKYVNVNERYPQPYKKHVWHSGLHAGTHGYAITLEAAKKVLAANFPIVMNADRAISYVREHENLKCYVAVPLIIRDDQSVPTSLNV